MARASRFPAAGGTQRAERLARLRDRRTALLRSLLGRADTAAVGPLRDARLRRIRQRLGFGQRVLEELGRQLAEMQRLIDAASGPGGPRRRRPGAFAGAASDEELLTEVDDGGYTAQGDYPDTSTPAGNGTTGGSVPELPPPTAGGKKLTRREQTLFGIFDELQGEDSEWTELQTPKVAAVNDRLETLGQDPSSRREIDAAYERYAEARSEEPGPRIRLTVREKALFRIFDDMQGQRTQFTEQGTPKVENVNDRLEALIQEPSSRKEIDAAYKKYQGEAK